MKRIFLLAALALVATPAFAQVSNADLAVSATVSDKCIVSGNTIAFGAYDPTDTHAAAPLDTTAATAISLTCTVGTTWTMTLDAGDHPTGGTPSRAMTDGTSMLEYELYSDFPGGTVFVSMSDQGTGAAQTVDLHGRIASNQQVTPGNYADTVTIAVNY